jgi:conjugative transfer signal peptidase TraF
MRPAWPTRALTVFATSLAAFTALVEQRPKLVWNASASVPIGLYAVRPIDRLHVGELVVVRPPQPLDSFLDRRGYLPLGVPLVKHVVGLSGQRVCRLRRTITVDGVAVAVALERDRRGRALPSWTGCRVIRPAEVFLMNLESRDSLDGRYFGPLPITAIIGQAQPLWIERQR